MKHEGKNCIYHKKDSHRVLLTEPVGKTAAHQAPPSMGFSKQECWSGVPLPSPTESPQIAFNDDMGSNTR